MEDFLSKKMSSVVLVIILLCSSLCQPTNNSILGSWSTCSDLGYEEIHINDNDYYFCPEVSTGFCFRYQGKVVSDTLLLKLDSGNYNALKIVEVGDRTLILRYEFNNMEHTLEFTRIRQRIKYPGRDSLTEPELEAYLAGFNRRKQLKKCTPGHGSNSMPPGLIIIDEGVKSDSTH